MSEQPSVESTWGEALTDLSSDVATEESGEEGQHLDEALEQADGTQADPPTPGVRERDAFGRFIPTPEEKAALANATPKLGADGKPIPEAKAEPPVPFQYRANKATQTFAGATQDPTTGAVTFPQESVEALRRQLANGVEIDGHIQALRQRHEQDIGTERTRAAHFETEHTASQLIAVKAIDYLRSVLSEQDFAVVQREMRLDLRDARGAPKAAPPQRQTQPQGQQPQTANENGFEQAAKGALDDHIESMFLDLSLAKLFPAGPERAALRQEALDLWAGFIGPDPKNPQSGEKHIYLDRLQAFIAKHAELQKVKATAKAATTANAFNGNQNKAPTGTRRPTVPPQRGVRSANPNGAKPAKAETISEFYAREREKLAQMGLDSYIEQ